jgi:hypothetical protein
MRFVNEKAYQIIRFVIGEIHGREPIKECTYYIVEILTIRCLRRTGRRTGRRGTNELPAADQLGRRDPESISETKIDLGPAWMPTLTFVVYYRAK